MASLDLISDWLRREIVVPSGGWLADIVPLVSDAVAIWDVFVLSALFVASWVVLRVSDSLTSLILGLGFDLTIPLQHYLNPKLVQQHQAHLDGYWPIFTFATGVEVLCFFLIHPDLFTLVVCVKTMLMLVIWLGRRSDGSFMTAGRGTGRAFQSPFPSSEASSLANRDGAPSRDRDRDRDRRRDRDRDPAPEPVSTAPEQSAAQNLAPDRPAAPERRSDTPRQGRPKTPNRRAPRDDLQEHAPPGLGPPITDADLADDLAERALRRKKRGKDSHNLAESDDPNAYQRDANAYDSDDAGGNGAPGASFFERFKNFRRTEDKSGGPGHREPRSPPDLYTPRNGGRIAAPGVTQHQAGHTIGKGGYKGIYIDDFSSEFQCPIEIADKADPTKKRLATRAEKRADRLTAPWERALEHDSIDLLQFYLFAEGVHDHIRGWIIMDILEERDERAAREMAMGWREVYQLPLSSSSRKAKIRKLLEPYRSFQHRQDVWRPAVGDWWSRARIGAHGAKINVEYGLDDLLWKMRAIGVSPSARHAMVRHLLSMPSEDEYLDLKKKLLSVAERKNSWADPSKYKARKDELVYYYQNLDEFEGQDVISQARLSEIAEEMVAARVPRATIGKVLKEIRWNLPKGGWRGVLNRIQDAGGL